LRDPPRNLRAAHGLRSVRHRPPRRRRHGRSQQRDGRLDAGRQFLIDQLKPISTGLNTGASGDAAYTQALPGGTNVVAVIPGTDLADEYVVVGAHYDHLGSSCQYKSSGDTICNGATDNAAGVAAALAIARSIAAQPTKPRRSVVIGLWDEEEDGLVGSRYYADHPLVPLADTVGYVNFDIQGANLLPSLRNKSFAVASESGGDRFEQIVRSAVNGSSLDTDQPKRECDGFLPAAEQRQARALERFAAREGATR